MNDLIALVNKLQEVFTTVGTGTAELDLPQIVVVGSQSSGKSSVLENIVQRDFLPRGSGIVTRRPLVLQLVNIPDADDGSGKEYGEFLHIQNRRFYDFDEIRAEIEADTARIAGTNKGISRVPIHLRVFSPKVLNITLVDTPGLTKIPIGDQPMDIEKQTRALVLDYISKPNSLILAVSAANVDLVNSDSLKLARQVDPEGKRTIGVLTKLDLMDAGTNALDILSGRAYPLKFGFIGIVNRSQQDIITRKPMSEALKAEKEFFIQHPAYRTIAHRCGTPHLAKTLNNILMNHIRERLPELKAKLNTMIGQTQQELASYGDATFSGTAHRGTLILNLLTKFANDFVSSIDGTSPEISTKELCGGARIYFIFNNVFGQALEAIHPCANLSAQDIRTAIRNSTGPRATLFVPEITFELLVKPQIQLLEPPSLRCVELVYEELMKVCHSCGNKELQRFPRFHAKLIEVVSDLLRERLGPTSTYVESLISIQRSYINTNHPDFIGGAAAMSSLESSKAKRQHQHLHQHRRPSSASTGPGAHKEEAAETQNGPTETGPHSAPSATSSSAASSPSGQRHLTTPTNGQLAAPTEPTNVEDSQDSFFMYFFGGANKSDRAALGPPDMVPSPHSTQSKLMYSLEQKRKPDIPSAIEGKTNQLTKRDEFETQLIRTLIISYFNIVRKTVQDLVPKAVMHLLVNHCRETVQNRLVSALYKEDLFEELLQEDEALAQERAKCEAMLDVYRRAFAIINEAI
ncbi:uncharacterized protein VTP21DRAFT_7142 [Calcarisporiella thermophila]|uniref:uncharacterized protein n=1 Tax=Calcarisporiella thermophila TaxID=911321 RepID=UPI0037435AFC